jgi:hypothetical protein
MKGHRTPGILMLAIIAGAPTQSPADSPPAARPPTTGFYPLWENTGEIEAPGRMYLGSNGAQIGINDWAQAGTQPTNFLYRIPNASVKFRLDLLPEWKMAAQVGAYYLLEAASSATLSPMYASRLDNRDFRVLLTPLSVSASRSLTPSLAIHQTVTALGLLNNSSLQNSVSFAYSVFAEFAAFSRHSLLLHASEVGFWNHDHFMLGASYRWSASVFEFRAGYFYRITPDTVQAAPLISVGWYL